LAIKSKAEVVRVIREAHEGLAGVTAGHFARDKLWARIKDSFWYPGFYDLTQQVSSVAMPAPW